VYIKQATDCQRHRDTLKLDPRVKMRGCRLAGRVLQAGDGAAVKDEAAIAISAEEDAGFSLFGMRA
jgi:hypothetical protein